MQREGDIIFVFLQRKENWGSVCSGGGGGATPRTFGREGQDGAEKKNTITETWHQWGKEKRLQTSNIPFFPFICYMTKVTFARRMAPKTHFMSRGQEERETVMSATDERG